MIIQVIAWAIIFSSSAIIVMGGGPAVIVFGGMLLGIVVSIWGIYFSTKKLDYKLPIITIILRFLLLLVSISIPIIYLKLIIN